MKIRFEFEIKEDIPVMTNVDNAVQEVTRRIYDLYEQYEASKKAYNALCRQYRTAVGSQFDEIDAQCDEIEQQWKAWGVQGFSQ